MITLRELVTCLIAGGVLIVFGLVPSLFQGLAEGIRNFVDALSSPFQARQQRNEQIETPRLWLVGVGLALIVASVLGYTSAGT